MTKLNLKINDTLYKYSSPSLMIYKVFGILEREDGIYYQIRCESCHHGKKCEVLIRVDDQGRLVYVSMLNEDEEDKQYYWHTTDEDDFYQLHKPYALENVVKRNIKCCYNQKRKLELEEYLKELEDEIKEIQKKQLEDLS